MANAPLFSSDSYISLESQSTENNTKSSSKNCHHLRKNKFQKYIKQKPKFSQNESRENYSMPCPWKRTASYSCGIIGLHEEINDFYETMQPTNEEREIRDKVIEHITKVVHSLWPAAQVEIFGSYRTGLYLPSSDIDMVILGKWVKTPLSTLAEALHYNGINDVDIIAKAKVPLVRVFHNIAKIKVDISFNVENGASTAKFIKNMIKEYPVLPKLVYVLKQFLIQRSLNEVYSGGMSSYCLTLLVVSMLQGFHKPRVQPSTNLGTLLLEFFELYGVNFSYRRVSIHMNDGGKYQTKHHDFNSLIVEDPFGSGNNIAKGTYLMEQLQMSFKNAYHLLSNLVITCNNTSVSSYLIKLFQVKQSVLGKRRKMQQNCTEIMRNLSNLIENINSGPNYSKSLNLNLPSTSNSFRNSPKKSKKRKSLTEN